MWQMNVLYWLSAAAFCALLTRPLPASFLLAPAAVLPLAFCLWRNSGITKKPGSSPDPDEQRRRPSARALFAAAVLSMLLAALFCIVWLRTRGLVSLQGFDRQAAGSILLSAAVWCLLSLPFSLRVIGLFSRHTSGKISADLSEKAALPENHKDTPASKWLLLLVAAVAITICSASSPLYPLNDWVDANCFFTVGKSMLFGKVPYRDLYEQKGPLLYALYALAYPISHRSFLGVWLFEIAAAWLFLLRSERLIRRLGVRRSLPAVLLTAAFVYTCPAFLRGGSAEEFCLPLLMLPLCTGTEVLLEERGLRTWEAFRIGLGAGAVLWVKYSMLGLYPGWFVFLAVRMLRRGQGKQLVRDVLAIVGGVLLVTAPVLLYFALNHAVPDLWQAYVVNNIFTYGKSSSILSTVRGLLSGAASMLTYNDGTVLALLLALAVFLREGKRQLAGWLFVCFACAFAVVYVGGINMKYYSEILCVFVPFGAAALCRLVAFAEETAGLQTDAAAGAADRMPSSKKPLAAILSAALFVLCLAGSENHGMLLKPKAAMPQYRFEEILKEHPGATLFNYGALDIGQYTVSGLVPVCRYFCMLNLQSDEMFREMNRYMDEGVTDFIVSRDLPVVSPRYRLLMQAKYPTDGVNYTYYLYERTETEKTE